MKFHVTEYKIIDGVWSVLHKYETEPDLLNRTHQGLQTLIYAGMINGYSTEPRQECQITNADKIRQMTDEELADVLQGQCACCAYQLTGCTERKCKDGVYEWLKQEVGEDATD